MVAFPDGCSSKGVGWVGKGLWKRILARAAARAAFKNVDDLIKAAGQLVRLKGGVLQGTVKGDAKQIMKEMAENAGVELQQKGKETFFRLGDGTRVGLHTSSTTGVPTIHVNKGGQLYKVRVAP